MSSPTIKDVARKAGVSVGTVSRYLNGGHARPYNAERIESAIAILGYRPNALGRYLVTGRTQSVGVLVPDAGNVFSALVASELQDSFEALGYTALFVDYRHSREMLERKVNFLQSRQVDGLVVLLSEMQQDDYQVLSKVDVPLVAIDNPFEARGVDSVVVNNRQTSAALVGAMLDAGHRRVGVVCLPRNTYVGAQRYLGWLDAHRARGIEPSPDDVLEAPATKAGGRRAMRTLLERGHITGVYTCNYYLTLGALKELGTSGLTPGRDIGFATFDDFDFGEAVFPPIARAQQPTAEIGQKVVELLSRRIEGYDGPGAIHVLDSSLQLTRSLSGGLCA